MAAQQYKTPNNGNRKTTMGSVYAVAEIEYTSYSSKQHKSKLDFHESVHRDTTMKITNKMHYVD